MKSILAILILGAVFLFCRPAFCADVVSIALIYPQASNAPKREAQKKEPPLVVKDKIPIDVTGISREQLNHPELYVEYFLDDKLIYTSEERKGKGKTGFIFDPRLYPEGAHTLIVNLWDKDGPSAIGIRKIIIQNQE